MSPKRLYSAITATPTSCSCGLLVSSRPLCLDPRRPRNIRAPCLPPPAKQWKDSHIQKFLRQKKST